VAITKVEIKDQIDNLIKSRDLYFVGSKLPSDWYEAYSSWLPLADAGDAKAQVNVGYCSQHGLGTDKSVDQAIAYYELAAAQNDPRAHYSLYQLFEVAKKDTEQSRHYLERAYEMKEGRAIFEKNKRLAQSALENGERDKAIEYWRAVVSSSATPHQIEYASAAIIGLSLKVQSAVVGSVETSTSTFEGGVFQGTTQYHTTTNYRCPVEVTFDNPTEFSCFSIELLDSSTGSYLYFSRIKSGVQTCTHNFSSASYGNDNWAGKQLQFDEIKIDPSPFDRELSAPKNPLGEIIIKLTPPLSIKTPSLFSKGGGCFVLTACYGSADAPTVYAFRQFRDTHLTRYSLGRRFIGWYYKYGPAWAEKISSMPRTRSVLRGVFTVMAKVLPK